MFKDELKKLRKDRGWTQDRLAKMMNVAKSTISMYESGRRKPDFETRELLADIFNVDIKRFSDSNDSYFESESKKRNLVPVLGYVRAGLPIEAIENIIDYEEISTEMALQGEHFALKIKGDSMEPRMREDDVVIIRKQETVENGEIAVVLVNGNDATVKKFYRTDNGINLISFNSNYEPFTYSPAEVDELPVSVIGKVVELRAKF